MLIDLQSDAFVLHHFKSFIPRKVSGALFVTTRSAGLQLPGVNHTSGSIPLLFE